MVKLTDNRLGQFITGIVVIRKIIKIRNIPLNENI